MNDKYKNGDSSGNFILKGNLIFSRSPEELIYREQAYAVCVDGISAGVFPTFRELLPEYQAYPVYDCGDALILPGLTDLHMHAPQFGNRGMAMDLELLDWLEQYSLHFLRNSRNTFYTHHKTVVFAV